LYLPAFVVIDNPFDGLVVDPCKELPVDANDRRQAAGPNTGYHFYAEQTITGGLASPDG
jgi:hypothetical protein